MGVVKKNTSMEYSRELSNSRSWVDFQDSESLALYASKDQWREKLIHTMLKWAEKNSSLEIGQFCIKYKIPYRTLKEWVDKYPDIKRAYGDMKHIVATHRKVGAMVKKLDGNYAYRDMHVYDPEWHEVNKYHADLKKIEEEEQRKQFAIYLGKPVVMEKSE